MDTAFWRSAAERAVKTFAQAVLALLGTGSVGITSLDWRGILSVAATAALASVLTSLASLSTVAAPKTPDKGPDSPSVALEPAPAAVFPAAKVDAALAQPAVEPVTVTPVFTPPAA